MCELPVCGPTEVQRSKSTDDQARTAWQWWGQPTVLNVGRHRMADEQDFKAGTATSWVGWGGLIEFWGGIDQLQTAFPCPCSVNDCCVKSVVITH